MMRTQQVIWTKQGVAEVQLHDVPPPKSDEVLVRTHLTLISPGTERAWFLGAPGAAFEFPGPAFGYSNVGEILEVGGNVSTLKIGQRIAAAAGHLGHYTIAAAGCLPLADAVTDDAAVFFNLIAIALQGVRKARIELGESVLVIGGGLIGLFAMQLAKLQGALPVAVIDQDEGRAAFARQIGADAAANPNHPPAVVIEATGAPAGVNRALELAGRFSRVILLGSTRGEVNGINVYRDVHYKGLTIIGAHASTRPKQDSAPGYWTLADDYRTALRLLEAQRIVTAPLITHRLPAERAAQAYDLLASRDLTALAMTLDWTGG